MKNHENQPGTMKNQPGTMKNQPGTVKPTSRTQLEKVIIFRDKHTAPIIYRYHRLESHKTGKCIFRLWNCNGKVSPRIANSL